MCSYIVYRPEYIIFSFNHSPATLCVLSTVAVPVEERETLQWWWWRWCGNTGGAEDTVGTGPYSRLWQWVGEGLVGEGAAGGVVGVRPDTGGGLPYQPYRRPHHTPVPTPPGDS